MLLQDLRYGVRMLLKHPGFTCIAVLTLGLGIGATVTIFSTVDALVLRPFAFAQQDRLMMVWETDLASSINRSEVSPGNFTDWQTQNRSFERMIAMQQSWFDLTAGTQPERFTGYRVSADMFTALGVSAALGRTLLQEDGQPGREQVAVIHYDLWQRRFGADPNLIGRTIKLNNRDVTIVGVMPQDFNFPYHLGEIWTPLLLTPQERQDHGNHYLDVMGLLNPGVTPAQAESDLQAIAARLQQIYPETNTGRSLYVISLNQHFTRGVRAAVPALIGSVVFLLLIACVNVANLLLARAATRQKEIALRLALGAGRWRIIRQLLVESLLLALLGGGLGLLLSVWSIPALANGIPATFTKFIPGWQHLEMNSAALVYTLLIAVLTGLLFGLVPAWQATKLNLNETLKEGSSSSSGLGVRNRFRSSLVVAEIAMSLVLLIGAGLMIRSLITILNADFGFNPQNVLTLNVSLPREQYPEAAQRISFYERFLGRLAALPGVVKVGAISHLPMGGSSSSSNFRIVGQPEAPAGRRPHVDLRAATPDYFEAVGTPLRRGRLFTDRDDAQAAKVVLVNEAFAARFFPAAEAMGQRLQLYGETEVPLEIIGVVGNIKNEDLDERDEPGIYLPHAQRAWGGMDLVIRTSGEPTQLAAAVRNELSTLDKTRAVFNIRPMQQVVNERIAPKRLLTWMLGIFALIALVLALAGIYAVMSFIVAQRTHEVGIRIALGAQSNNVLELILRQGMHLTLWGVLLGLIASITLTRLMKALLFGVSATDPLTFARIAGCCCWSRCWRAGFRRGRRRRLIR